MIMGRVVTALSTLRQWNIPSGHDFFGRFRERSRFETPAKPQRKSDSPLSPTLSDASTVQVVRHPLAGSPQMDNLLYHKNL